MLTAPGLRPPARRRGIAHAFGFARAYAVAAAGSAYLFTLGWTRRVRRQTIVGIAEAFGHRRAAAVPSELPTVTIDEVAPPGALIDVRAIETTHGNVSERELVAICRITRMAAPRRAFEFGTFDGRTTLNLAANAAPDARVYTLDLPRAGLAAAADRIEPGEHEFVDKDVSGARFRGSDLEPRIVQLYGDSATFDYAPLYGTMQLVFVDASHAYEYVVNDSLQALRLLDDGGWIIWHDYAWWDGVTRALDDLRRVDARFRALRHVAGTTLAVLRVEPSATG